MRISAAGREWEWPDADTKCRAVVFDEYSSLRAAYAYLSGHRTAIQAGGNMGAFPWKLAQRFDRVITAEPDPICFPYLDRNVQEINVEKLNVAFSDDFGSVHMEYPQANNLGAQHIAPGGDIPAVTIDSLRVDDCDLIYLDIEGAELAALRGAEATIIVSSPLIVIEDKGLSTRFGSAQGDAGRWLIETFGYRQVGTSKRDVIYACE